MSFSKEEQSIVQELILDSLDSLVDPKVNIFDEAEKYTSKLMSIKHINTLEEKLDAIDCMALEHFYTVFSRETIESVISPVYRSFYQKVKQNYSGIDSESNVSELLVAC